MKCFYSSVLAFSVLFLGLVYGNPIPEESSSISPFITSTTSDDPLNSESEETSDELNELQGVISPKLFMFLQHLALIDPELLETGEARLAALRLMGRDEVDEIIASGNPNPDEVRQFKSDLAKVSRLVRKYPEIKKLIQISFSADHEDSGSDAAAAVGSTIDPLSLSTEELLQEVDPFFEEFTRIDKELSRYPEWNRYWTYWFKRYADYMQKFG